jgi:tetratricopeptide (TPR) repeat protein
LQKARRFQEAADVLREELAIYEKLTAALPTDPDYRFYQAAVANYLGVALRHLPEETETAVGHHRQAIKICELLVAQFPDQTRYRGQLMNGHWGLGLALMASGRWTEVEASFQQALAGLVSLGLADQAAGPADQDPPVAPSVRNDLAWLLATCPDEKIRDPRRAVELAKKAVELDPRASILQHSRRRPVSGWELHRGAGGPAKVHGPDQRG